MLDLSFFKSRSIRILTILFLAQGAIFYNLPAAKEVNLARPLSELDRQLPGWAFLREHKIEDEVQAVLKADDTLSRDYASESGAGVANLFVAFFSTQSQGRAPHSPKNCLPGSGWAPLETGMVKVQVSGRAEPIEVNRYIVARGDQKSMVYYWYQSHSRVVASEYLAKIYLVTDSIRDGRSDTSLVRVTAAIPSSPEGAAQADKLIQQFIGSLWSPLSARLPS